MTKRFPRREFFAYAIAAAGLTAWEVMVKMEPENCSATWWVFRFYSQIKFSCQYFGLKFAGMLQNTKMHLFGKFGGSGGCRLSDKWLEPQNGPEIWVFYPLCTPKKGSGKFFYHHCKGKAFRKHLLFESWLSNIKRNWKLTLSWISQIIHVNEASYNNTKWVRLL